MSRNAPDTTKDPDTTQDREVRARERPPAPGSRRARRTVTRLLPVVLSLVVLAALQSVVIADLDLPLIRPLVAIGTFWLLPALVIHRRAPLRADHPVTRACYALGLSLLGLMVVGLLVNTVLAGIGVARPLSPPVLGVTWLLIDGALLVWRGSVPLVPGLDLGSLGRRAWAAPIEPAQACAVAAVPVAVVGAVRLNNGLGGWVALAGHVLVVVAFATLMLRRCSLGHDLRVLVLGSASLLLATSLRGWGVTGHDVQAEYYAFGLTADAQHWSMELLQNAYNACLSVTLLPTVLAEVTGLSGVWWFKVGLQLLFATAPALSYLAFRRFVPRRLALVATSLVVAFPTFHNDMPYLVRQEVAFLFLALLLLVATDRSVAVRTRRVLTVVFGVGIVLSHYSTTYLLQIGLVAGLAVLGLLTWLGRRRGWVPDRRPLVLLHPGVVAAVAAASLLWTGPITGTGSHPLDVAEEAIAALIGGNDEVSASDRRFFIIGGSEETARDRMDRYVEDTLEARADVPRRLLAFPEPDRALTKPKILPQSEAPLTPVSAAVESAGGDPGAVVVLLRLLSAVLLQVLLLTGVWWIGRARWRGFRDRVPRSDPSRSDDDIDESQASLELAAVVSGVLTGLALVVVVPSLSVEYGVLRAFMQALLFLAPVAAVGLWWWLRLLGRRSAGWLVGTAVALVAVLTATLPALVGGGPPTLALANAGVYYERYIVTDSDETAIDRLAEAPDTSGRLPKVLAPTNQAARLAQAGVPLDEMDGRMFPLALNVRSYVFTDSRISGRRKDTLFLRGDRVTYRYPRGRLDGRLDLIYSAGQSRIYR